MDNSLAQSIKSRVNLSNVIGAVVKLKGRSPNFLGLCPFHQEKTPSFHVRDQKGRFKCFGCGASGDVFEFLMRLRGISFVEAVREVGAIAGISADGVINNKKKDDEDQLLRAQKLAHHYFINELFTDDAKQARDYLKSRGIDKEMVRQAGIGFGGSSLTKFINYLNNNRITEQCAIEAGLVKPGRFSLQHHFLARITFPIRNNDGQLIAFAGRSLSDNNDTPKYVNTHSYKHFEKRRVFYGLFESKAAIARGQSLVLVEGYFDAMAFWALGFPAIALCGTALSEDHVEILQRLTKKIVISFDADEAGRHALINSVKELYKKDVNVGVLNLSKKDPGMYLLDKTLHELKNIAERPEDALCYLIDRSALQAKKSVKHRIDELDKLLPIFSLVKRPLLRRQYVSYLASKLHEDVALLWTEIEKNIKSKRKGIRLEPKLQEKRLSSKERLLVEIILSNPGSIKHLQPLLVDIPKERQDLITNLSIRAQSDHSYEEIKAYINSVERALWAEIEDILRFGKQDWDIEKALKDLIEDKGRQDLKNKIREKRQEIKHFEALNDYPAVLRALKEQRELLLEAKPLTKPVIQPGPNPSLAMQEKKAKQIPRLEEKPYFDATEDWL